VKAVAAARTSAISVSRTSRGVGTLRNELRAIQRRDYFPPPERDHAQATIQALTVPTFPVQATAFDIRSADLAHRGGGCTFETIPRTYDLSDPVRWRIAAIVHQADLNDDSYDAPKPRAWTSLARTLDDPRRPRSWPSLARSSTASTSTTAKRRYSAATPASLAVLI
jgi:hypothetical protein